MAILLTMIDGQPGKIHLDNEPLETTENYQILKVDSNDALKIKLVKDRMIIDVDIVMLEKTENINIFKVSVISDEQRIFQRMCNASQFGTNYSF